MKAKHDMTKRNAKSNVTVSNTIPSIVLKTLHDDIMRDNANATITTKKMRIWLRANMNAIHVANASWIFTQSQYDAVRAHFDPVYRARIERAAKRAAPATPRAKRVVKTNAPDVIVSPAPVNA